MKTQLKYYLKKIIRQGPTFNRLFNELKKSQYLSIEQLEDLQNKKLRKLVRHCYKNVPYYRELFNQLNLKPEDIKTKDDLKKLPFLDKHIIRQNQDKLIAKNRMFSLCNIAQTSGTTGTPLKLYRDYHSINFENAAVWRHYRNAGDSGLKRITLRGQIVVPVDQKEPPFWQYIAADKELLMSSYHLSDKTAKIFVEKILEFNPQILSAYPSSVYLLAKYFNNLNQKLTLKAIFTSAEKLATSQRKLIEETFNCRIFDWYGQAERSSAIAQCENGTYHIIEDYSIVETIETCDGFEVVGTNLDNYLMPFLRYRTGDTIKLATNKCTCGRNFREVSEICGRETNYYIVTPNGIQITAFDHIPRGIGSVIETQIIQEKIGELIINVTASDKFSEKDEETLIRNAREHTASDMKVIINKMDSIPRGANGKFVYVINKLIDKNNQKLGSNCEQ